MARDIAVTIRAVDQFSSVFRQYNEALKDVGTSSKTLAATAQQQQNAFSNLATGVKGAIAAYAGLKGLQMVGDMIQLGDAANRAESVFRTLTASMGGYASNMAAMRQATSGIVDDMTLQESGAKLLQMGLATTTEEMARLSEMAVKLGGAMGMSVEKSFSDFSLMLANQSIMRLDQFGLSGARVRARILELKETMGLTREEAFKMAVLEQGAVSLERLGLAADAAVTPMARLQSSMANFAQDFAQNVATAVNSLVGLGEIALGTSPLLDGQKDAERNAALGRNARNQVFLSSMGGFGGMLANQGIDVGANFDESAYLLAIRQLMMSDPDMLGQNPLDAAMVVGGDMFGDYDTNLAVAQMFETAFASMQMSRGGMLADISRNYASQFFNPANFTTTAGILGARGAPGAEWMSSDAGMAFTTASNPWATGGRADIIAQRGRDAVARHRETLMARGELAQYEGTYGETAGMQVGEFMRPADADAIAQTYDAVTADFERIQALADQGLIGDDELERARNLKDQVGQVADAAQRAADNFNNMALSDVFGQQGGGMFGEITDMVMGQLADSGMSEDQLGAMQQSFDLASGRETAASIAMQDTVAPMLANIAQQFGPEVAAQAVQNLQTFMREATLAGLSQEQIAAALPEATGFAPGTAGAGGQTFDIKPGDTLSAISAQTGIPVSQLLAATGASSAGTVQPGTYSLGGGVNQIAGFDPMAYFSMIMSGGGMAGGMGMAGKGETNIGMLSGGQWGQAGLVGDLTGADTPTDKSPLDAAAEAGLEKLSDLNSSAQEAVDKVMEIGTAFDAIPAAVPIRLDLSVNDPSGVFMQLMAALGGADSLAALVADSGGALPGGNPRGGRGANGRPNAGRGGNR